MSIEIAGINHGLSVHTTADGTIGAGNRRLLRPVPQEDMTTEGKYDIVVYNTFNDATSGDRYHHPSGHEAIELRLRHRHPTPSICPCASRPSDRTAQ